MPTPAEKIAQLIADQAINHTILHGPASAGSTVATEGDAAQKTVPRLLDEASTTVMSAVGTVATTAILLSMFGALIVMPAGATFQTSARDALGDGGGGLFYYDPDDTSTADNGGTVRVDSQGRRWKFPRDRIKTPQLFGADDTGAKDDTAVWAALLATAGKIYVPSGTYQTNWNNGSSDAALVANTTLYGDGPSSVIKCSAPTAARAILGCNGASTTETIDNITIRDLTLLGSVQANGHSETKDTGLYCSGVRNLLVERVHFIGARTDGLYLGSGVGGGPSNETHNYDVTIRDCVFDGTLVSGVPVGRNGISIIDVDGLLVENNDFVNWAKSDMPGSIDLEPNEEYSVIANVRITRNGFKNCGGNRGHISIATDNIEGCHNIEIDHNDFDGALAALGLTSDTDLSRAPNNIKFHNNDVRNLTGPSVKSYGGGGSWWGLRIDDNVIYCTKSGAGTINLGTQSASNTYKDLSITGNNIVVNTPSAISVFDNIDGFKLIDNTVDGATANHITLGHSGTELKRVWVTGNDFAGSPSTQVCSINATFKNPYTNVWRNNITPIGLPINFPAITGD